jgi:hypothetical protein
VVGRLIVPMDMLEIFANRGQRSRPPGDDSSGRLRALVFLESFNRLFFFWGIVLDLLEDSPEMAGKLVPR